MPGTVCRVGLGSVQSMRWLIWWGGAQSSHPLRLVKDSTFSAEDPPREAFLLEYFKLPFLLPGCLRSCSFMLVPTMSVGLEVRICLPLLQMGTLSP